MRPEVMKDEYSRLRSELASLLSELSKLLGEAGASDLAKVASVLAGQVEAPFLFVVVGEVKSGKSSFINALLGSRVCEVAPDPCTDRIQKIVYSDKPFEEPVSEHVIQKGLPEEILKEIAIVDTPGTNSIIEEHQEITEGFIPESDLVVFVFPILNPYSGKAWDFFNFVHAKWHKKIIFVLQQADRASQEELDVNRERVREYAINRGVEAPVIFTVSAKQALEDPAKGGMGKVWDYIRETITGGRQYALKISSLITSAQDVLQGFRDTLQSESTVLEEDREEAARIDRALTRGQEAALREVESLKERMVASYMKFARLAEEDFADCLSAGSLIKSSISGFFRKKGGLKGEIERINREFQKKFTEAAESLSREGGAHISESIMATMEGLRDDLKRARPADPRDMRVSGLAKERLQVMDKVVFDLTRFLEDETLTDRMRPRNLEKMGDQAVMGGFITAVGAILAATTHAVAFDVTGGIISTLGALMTINVLALKRRSVIRRFRQGFEQGREKFEQELAQRLAEQVAAIHTDVAKAFEPFLQSIQEREIKIQALITKGDTVEHDLTNISNRLAAL